jgi:Fic family protein
VLRVAAALDVWRTFTLAFDPRTPEIVRQILSHWMFAHIHPVTDGNGRIGRLLVPLMLRSKCATQAACACFGEAVREDKDLYVEALRAARRSGDMGPWTRLMLSFLERTATANLARLARLAAVDAEWCRVASAFRSDSMVHKLAPFALTRPAFTMRDALDAIGGTFASVNTAAARLVEAGVLTIANEARRDRLYRAGAVLEIFDRFRVGRGKGG